MRPIVLAIAGSDPSGGAGIQADLKAIEASGGYAATAITAVTVQNTRGVRRIAPLPAGLVGEQIEAVLSDLKVAAVKTGMLGDDAVLEAVVAAIETHGSLPLVVDPVLVASDGTALHRQGDLALLLDRLLPLATVVTPNVSEAERLSGQSISDVDQAGRAGRRILEHGCRAVLITGGHFSDSRGTDVLVTRDGRRIFQGPALTARHGHGSGCTLASALATGLARGLELEQAVARSKSLVTEALRHGLAMGQGTGPVDALHRLHADTLEVTP